MLKGQLARNLRALSAARPGVFEAVRDAPVTGRYVVTLVGGVPGLVDRGEPGGPGKPGEPGGPGKPGEPGHGGKAVVMSAGPDPVAAVNDQMRQLRPTLEAGRALALLGVGDGYLLSALARRPPRLFMDMAMAVHVFEPDAELLRTVLMLHDFAGDDGPVRQGRFVWHVGPGWEASYAATCEERPRLPMPGSSVSLGRSTADLEAGLKRVHAAVAEADAGVDRAVQALYSGRLGEDCAAALAGELGRAARVMLVTSRFTTVLQHAARDTAAAFEALGCETRLVIEAEPEERAFQRSLQREVLAFEPDLVFLIDYLRQHHGDTYPPGLPMVSWLQDHMAHLTEAGVGERVDGRNFVLTFARPLFEATHGYPARQCIDVPMMVTRSRRAAGSGAKRGMVSDDLVYVSNVSGEPGALACETAAKAGERGADGAEGGRERVAAVGERLIEHYAGGGSVATYWHLRRFINATEAAAGFTPSAGEGLDRLVTLLWNPLNSALYRQQALGWAADAAGAMGLSLGVYGRGWEDHPRFGRYAKGVVAHGPALERLTRRARINLNLEPYACFTHQRLLDGVGSGGFFLVREHPTNTLIPRVHRFLLQHARDDAETAEAVRAALPAESRGAFDLLMEEAACVSWDAGADAVRQVRCWARAGVVTDAAEALPHLAAVSFHDAMSCRALIERYLGDGDARAAVSVAMRESVEGRLTFEAQMRRVLGEVVARLREE